MIDRGQLLEKISLTLGRITDYNSNSNEFRIVSEKLLNNIIREIAHNQNYTFNQVTVKPTLFELEATDGLYKYNKPFDFLNFAGTLEAFTEGEYIYSQKQDLEVKYNRTIELTEFPDYMLNLLRFETLKEIALAYPQYRERLNEFLQFAEVEKAKILTNEKKHIINYLKRRTNYGI